MQKEKVLTSATLSFLVKEGSVLLGFKTSGIGRGFWNGYGGGIKKGETEIRAAVRELKEEVGITAAHLAKVAIADFHNTKSDGKTFTCRVHIYLVKEWSGEPSQTKEMLIPTWFNVDRLPEMIPADKVWLPYILKGEKIMIEASLGPFQKTLLGEVIIKPVNDFSSE